MKPSKFPIYFARDCSMNEHKNQLWWNSYDCGFLVSMKTEKPYAQKFTKKASQKCALYNSVLCHKITSNQYSNIFFKLGKVIRQNLKSSQNDIGKTCQNPSASICAMKSDSIHVSFMRNRVAKGWAWDVGQILSNWGLNL